MAELSQTTEVSVKPTTPSAVYNNLSCCGSLFAFSHQQECVVVRPLGAHKLPIPEATKAQISHTSAYLIRGNVVVVFTSATGVQVWDVARDACLTRIPAEVGIEPRSAALVELGGRVFGSFGYGDGSVATFEFTAEFTPNLVGHHAAHQQPVSALAASSESTVMFASGCTGGTVQLWNNTLKPYVSLPAVANTECCTSIAICGATFVAVAYGSGKVRLFTPTGDIRVEIAASARWINAMAFNRQRMLLATAGDDSTVAVWTVPTTESPKVSLVGYRRTKNHLVTGVAFNHDGTAVMSSVFDVDKITTVMLP